MKFRHSFIWFVTSEWCWWCGRCNTWIRNDGGGTSGDLAKEHSREVHGVLAVVLYGPGPMTFWEVDPRRRPRAMER